MLTVGSARRTSRSTERPPRPESNTPKLYILAGFPKPSALAVSRLMVSAQFRACYPSIAVTHLELFSWGFSVGARPQPQSAQTAPAYLGCLANSQGATAPPAQRGAWGFPPPRSPHPVRG